MSAGAASGTGFVHWLPRQTLPLTQSFDVLQVFKQDPLLHRKGVHWVVLPVPLHDPIPSQILVTESSPWQL